jgi:exonuclease VII small subunit
MPKPKPAPKSVEELSYEEAFAELESIVETLEGGALLEDAQLKVKKLAGDALVEFEDAPE